MTTPVTPVTQVLSAEQREWRCFHCDEVFTDEAAARHHFGKSECDDPICGITAERYREVERQLDEHRMECDPLSRAFYAMGAEHYRKERDAEQKGYDRGLADAKAHPETIGLTSAARAEAAEAEIERLRATVSGRRQRLHDQRASSSRIRADPSREVRGTTTRRSLRIRSSTNGAGDVSADVIVLSVRLKSGGFESSIEVPIDAPPARRDACVRQWLGMMQAGLAMTGADVHASASWPVVASDPAAPQRRET